MNKDFSAEALDSTPDSTINARRVFDIDCDWDVPAFSKRDEHVPDVDASYQFDPVTTRAILAGFKYNRRVLISGFHGTGKSSHIEQVAARLNWPCLRINLDSHVTRMDLIGRDAIVLQDGQQVTQFQDGILPYSLQRPCALVFDEYDAGRPDVMFVIQRVLEAHGHLTLLDQSRVITPHPFFRLFATANTVGLGDPSGMYHGTNPLNQGQIDRWNIVSSLNYLPHETEEKIILSRQPELDNDEGRTLIARMVELANMTRTGFQSGDISTVMSPRSVIAFADNYRIFADLKFAFDVTFLNKCDESEHEIVNEYYQRCFGS